MKVRDGGFGNLPLLAAVLAVLTCVATPAVAYNYSVDISVTPGTSVVQGTNMYTSCAWSRSGTWDKPYPATLGRGKIVLYFNDQQYVINQVDYPASQSEGFLWARRTTS